MPPEGRLCTCGWWPGGASPHGAPSAYHHNARCLVCGGIACGGHPPCPCHGAPKQVAGHLAAEPPDYHAAANRNDVPHDRCIARTTPERGAHHPLHARLPRARQSAPRVWRGAMACPQQHQRRPCLCRHTQVAAARRNTRRTTGVAAHLGAHAQALYAGDTLTRPAPISRMCGGARHAANNPEHHRPRIATLPGVAPRAVTTPPSAPSLTPIAHTCARAHTQHMRTIISV